MTMRRPFSSQRLQPLPGGMHTKGVEEVQQQRIRTTLETIPLEVILSICDFLPPRSKATLAVTSKKLHNSLGDRYLALLKEKRMQEEKRSLLMLLKKDLRGLYLCWRCEQFHPITNCLSVGSGYSASTELQCVQEDGILELDSTHQMHFRHAYALMTRFRHHWPHNDEYAKLTFQHDGPVHYCPKGGHTAKSTISVLPQVRDQELFLSISVVIHLLDCCELSCSPPRSLAICPHLHPTFHAFFRSEDPTKIITDQIEKAKGPKGSSSRLSRDISCTWCKTWFSVKVSISKGGILTRQRNVRVDLQISKNLGICATPTDPTWKSHCLQLETSMERLK